jgi:hypothetical protein
MNLRAQSITSRLVAMVVMVTVALLFATLPRASADSVTVNSSTAVTYLYTGVCCTDFPAALTAANFASAQTGPNAVLDPFASPGYLPPLPGGPGAVAITGSGAASDGTVLYAVSFDLPSTVSSASLELFYEIDNNLGLTNSGVYLNGTALPNTIPNSCGVESTLCFEEQQSYSDSSIGSLLVSGTNWLYLDQVNEGSIAGVIFSADVTFVPSTGTVPVPEASSLSLLCTGLLGLGLLKRKAKLAV